MNLCPVIYGTDPQHFVVFGFISPQDNHCLASYGLVLCVVALPISPSPLPTITPTHAISPSAGNTTVTVPTVSHFVGHANLSNFFPYYNNVQVIGPKPIYITYNKVVGPSVSNNFGNSNKKTGINEDDKEIDYENPEVLTRDGKVDVVTRVLASSDDSRGEVLHEALGFIRNATLVNDQK